MKFYQGEKIWDTEQSELIVGTKDFIKHCGVYGADINVAWKHYFYKTNDGYYFEVIEEKPVGFFGKIQYDKKSEYTLCSCTKIEFLNSLKQHSFYQEIERIEKDKQILPLNNFILPQDIDKIIIKRKPVRSIEL